MNSVNAFQKRLRDEVAAVEKEIQSHNQQIEAFGTRFGGLKRAPELFESEQPAIGKLLRTSIADGSGPPREMATASATTMQRARA